MIKSFLIKLCAYNSTVDKNSWNISVDDDAMHGMPKDGCST